MFLKMKKNSCPLASKTLAICAPVTLCMWTKRRFYTQLLKSRGCISSLVRADLGSPYLFRLLNNSFWATKTCSKACGYTINGIGQGLIPVILISFTSVNYQGYGLEEAISRKLKEHAAEYQITLTNTHHKAQFEELIKKSMPKREKSSCS